MDWGAAQTMVVKERWLIWTACFSGVCCGKECIIFRELWNVRGQMNWKNQGKHLSSITEELAKLRSAKYGIPGRLNSMCKDSEAQKGL